MNLFSGTEMWLMIGFAILIPVMLVLDLGLFNKKSHKVSNKEAGIWTAVWVGLAMIFGVVIYFTLGAEKSTQFYTAFLIEKALSVDNLFVFILVFTYFKVPDKYHHRVLFWGIIGAIVFRAIFIFTGATIINLTYVPSIQLGGFVIHNLNIVLTFFGGLLVYFGIKTLKDDDDNQDYSNNLGVKIIRKLFPVKNTYEGGKFFVKEKDKNGVLKKFATMLLVVVAVIEVTDVAFAVDSIPAIFTVSQDPFILYSSNIFAILGLRTLYFLLNNFMQYFSYLKYGLSIILAFIGVKMLIAPVFHISSPISLSIVGAILFVSMMVSILFAPKKNKDLVNN